VGISRGLLLAVFALCGWFGAIVPSKSADLGPQPVDLGPQPSESLTEPAPPPSQWQFSFTPYGWMININGTAAARGHTVDINDNFFEIVEKSDSIMALMGYFEARKGRFGFFTDAVWADLGFPGHLNYDVNRSVSGNPFARLPDFKATIKGSLNINANAQLDYQSTIIQSGIFYQVAKWGDAASYTALDVMGSARYWNQDVDLSLSVEGTLTAAIQADFKRVGLRLRRELSRSRTIEVAHGGDLEWVDPVVGTRLRHQFASGSEFNLEGDVGGFGAGSEFSWQAVATYGFDVNAFGTTMRSVVGYRALSVDYSQIGAHGRSGLDWVQHGPILGASFRW
jgi:hypothetical protein